ncbi:hypothetical protein NP493_44g05005 [Ridgeia piscesae]|uniref:Secreted protein n=1 Tax=Ridgeia piscesae TaxID=27915 RepID=A0AAD9UJR9_RIDPI|nr:hypothetical protein NP493_44g05005 [Ridgeia piscesae]
MCRINWVQFFLLLCILVILTHITFLDHVVNVCIGSTPIHFIACSQSTFFDALMSSVHLHQNLLLHVLCNDDTVSFQKNTIEHNDLLSAFPEQHCVFWTLISVLWPSICHSTAVNTWSVSSHFIMSLNFSSLDSETPVIS